MLPTCIGISGVSRYKKDASNEDSFLPSPMCFPPADFSHGALAALLALRLIVHVLPPHMQWQTARIGQIAGSGPLPERGDRRPPIGLPDLRPTPHGSRAAPRYSRRYRRAAA